MYFFPANKVQPKTESTEYTTEIWRKVPCYWLLFVNLEIDVDFYSTQQPIGIICFYVKAFYYLSGRMT